MAMATILEVRQALVDHGFVPIPVVGKAPPFKKWQKVENVSRTMLEAWAKNWPQATNTGILTKFTPTLDADILNEPAVIAIEDLVRERFEERGYILPRIGKAPKRAIPFRTPDPFPKITVNLIDAHGKTGEKIEFMCDGQQIVAAGIHPDTGNPYVWPLGNPTDIAHDDLPDISKAEAQQLVDDIVELLCRDFGYTRAAERAARKGNGARPGDPAEDWQKLVDDIRAGHELHANTRNLAAKMVRSGMDGGAIVNFLRGLMNSSAAPHDERWQDRYDDLPRLVDTAQAKFEQATAAAAAASGPTGAPPPAPSSLVPATPTPAPGSGSSGPPPPPPPPPPPSSPAAGPTPSAGAGPSPGQTTARQAYMRGRSAWACNAGNVLLALRQEPELIGAFGYDQMLSCDVLLRPLFKPDPNFVSRPVTDIDIIAVQEHLQWLGFRRLGTNTTHDAISKYAREHAFHPVREYLDKLAWDGEDRLQTWLVKCFGATHNAYNEKIGTMFLISMVARIYKPGCKVDYMMILEGDQGMLKSLACSILAGGYFSDQLSDITNKEAFQHLRGKWLIEVAELHTYSRAAVDHFKAFLTRQVERYRPPWGHKEVHEPRQCVFIGTTNKALYLKDATGNRRFWPIKTGDIDLDWLRTNRDQLFAEAVQLYRARVPWWPDRKFELETIRDEQEARYEPDAWEGPIRAHLDRKSRTTILDIATGALNYGVGRYKTPISQLKPAEQHRITAILTHLGWVPKRDMNGRWWEPG
jgi:hypothetical protein